MLGQQYLYAMLDDFRLERLRTADTDHPALARHDALELLRIAATDTTSPSALLLPLLPVWLLGDFAADLQSRTLEFPRVDGHFWDRLGIDGKRFVEARLPVRQHYESTLCEVRAWSRWTSNGASVRFVEEVCMPDLVVTEEGLADLWCEVKAVSSAAAESTVEKAVTKANRQLRGCQEGGGIAVFWLVRDDAAALAPTPAGTDGAVPADVADRIRVIAGRLHEGRHRSVAHAIVVWEQVAIREGAAGRTLTLERRQRVIAHPAPARDIPAPRLTQLQLEMTSVVRVR